MRPGGWEVDNASDPSDPSDDAAHEHQLEEDDYTDQWAWCGDDGTDEPTDARQDALVNDEG